MMSQPYPDETSLPPEVLPPPTLPAPSQHDEHLESPMVATSNSPGPPTSSSTREGIFARQSRRVAHSPCYYLLGSLFMAIVLSAIGMIVGEFSISANTGGWTSRGTLISDRDTQSVIVSTHLEELFSGDDAVWTRLLNNILPGWEDDDDDASGERRLQDQDFMVPLPYLAETWADYLKPQAADRIHLARTLSARELPLELTPRLLQQLDDSLEGRGCDTSWYTPANLTDDTRLWPVWKTTSSSKSILDPHVLRDICHAETKTQEFLEKKNLCFGCDQGCLPPFSIVMYARLVVTDGWSLSCDDLALAWEEQNYMSRVKEEWAVCVNDVKDNFDPTAPDQDTFPESCPPFFSTTFVEEFFEDGKAQYTSTIFATRWEQVDDLYDNVDDYDTAKASSVVDGTYDTQYEDFNNLFIDSSLVADMSLAMGSALVVAIAILLQSRSPFITLIGLVQIILSFPLSYLFYKMVFGLDFFPFLNFIGIFVVFALGAGDIFVAVDKWRSARLLSPDATTEDVAAKALPDAAVAMFLTTVTTAIAFFSTAVCPVAPITMFAIFCGLLITFDYVMNVLLVFPALCIYDRSLQRSKQEGRNINCCMSCSCFGLLKNQNETIATAEVLSNKNELGLDDVNNKDEEAANGNDDTLEVTAHTACASSQPDETDMRKDTGEAPSFMTRILSSFYCAVHATRWPLLVASMAALGICIYYSTTLELPTSSDVRLLSDKEPYEQNYLWRQKLLNTALLKASGSQAYVYWGIKAADTGDHNNPGTFSELVLDESFDSSSPDAQIFLRDFCESLLEQEFAIPLDANYTCPLTNFDGWLQDQSIAAAAAVNTTTPDAVTYAEHCNGASGLPMASSDWNACIIAWSQTNNEMSILSRSNEVAIIFVPFLSRVRFDDQYDILDKEWNLIEDWVQAQNARAPKGVDRGYFTSFDFWWYDTNGQMLSTAYSSAGIALLCSAVVIWASSKSMILTFFCTVTIAYVLTAVTATLVAIGWTLGFLESICFAILIGVSVDFCIHLAHAYASAAPGEEDREVRIKYALIHMGPSILATALTTVLSATVMLFTVITFFQKFALILFLTVVQATIGSLIVFVVMADCFGPRNPTYFYDLVSSWWASRKK